MSIPVENRLVVQAPAKLNLGLEILGRRDDGYHDLATILLAVSPTDRLSIGPGAGLRLSVDDPALVGDDNLALRALHLLAARYAVAAGAALALRKAIPAAAGLGGASSDAAAALRLGRGFWRLPATDDELAALAAGLGSDVPFFLRGGCALATGRGETLAPLPVPAGLSFVVVSPDVAISRKTATLYAALRPDDFSDGGRVLAQAARLRAGNDPDPDLLGNAFVRPLYALRPELADLPGVMRRLGAPEVALSGAGPSHYAMLDDPEAAVALANRLAGELGARARVFVSSPWVGDEGAEAMDHRGSGGGGLGR